MITENEINLKIVEFLEKKNKANKIKRHLRKLRSAEFELDSIEFVELIVYLEKAFDCEFDDYTLVLTKKKDYSALIEYILSKCNSKK